MMSDGETRLGIRAEGPDLLPPETGKDGGGLHDLLGAPGDGDVLEHDFAGIDAMAQGLPAELRRTTRTS
jgi:hypothetical protein